MQIPRALSIAGSDSGGGAGIQADLKTFTMLGVHGMTAITALTAQNTHGVEAVFDMPPAFVKQQISAVVKDIGVDAVKTGMLSNSHIVEAVADSIREFEITNLVCDPVFVSKHGDPLLVSTAVESIRTKLVPLAKVITPNVPEAEGLLGRELNRHEPDVEAAKALTRLGCEWVLLKGGHLESDESTDVLTNGDDVIMLTGWRHATKHTHGTGCTLSSAMAAGLAKGMSVPDAAAEAKKFVTRAIVRHLEIGSGIGPVNPAWGLW